MIAHVTVIVITQQRISKMLPFQDNQRQNRSASTHSSFTLSIEQRAISANFFFTNIKYSRVSLSQIIHFLKIKNK